MSQDQSSERPVMTVTITEEVEQHILGSIEQQQPLMPATPRLYATPEIGQERGERIVQDQTPSMPPWFWRAVCMGIGIIVGVALSRII